MEHKVWIRCHVCTEAFSAYLSEEPEANTTVMSHALEMEMQYGETAEDGQVYAECPNPECDANIMYFEWWESYRNRVTYYYSGAGHEVPRTCLSRHGSSVTCALSRAAR